MMDFAHATSDALFDYAANWEDQLEGEVPENLTWVFVEAFPLDALRGSANEWIQWFDKENEEADLSGYWAGLRNVVGTDFMDPLVVGLVNDSTGRWANVWDGSHRVGAACSVGMTCLPVVLGVPAGMTWAQVPSTLKQAATAHDAIAQVLGAEWVEPVAAARMVSRRPRTQR